MSATTPPESAFVPAPVFSPTVSAASPTPTDLRHRVPAQSLIVELAKRRAAAAPPLGMSRANRRPPITDEERPWFVGALGERHVASVLAGLGPEFRVLHSVPVGKGDSDIDHVVVGPSGVFTINTKHHPGKKVWVGGRGMLIAGHKVPHLRNAGYEARRAEKLLSSATGLTVPVTGIVVVVGASQLTIRRAPEADGVRLLVVHDTQLLKALQTRPEFSPEQVQRIADAASVASTWHKSPVNDGDVSALVLAFDELTGEVARQDKTVRRRKLLWALAAMLLPVAAVYTGLSVLTAMLTR
jgi:hypothetical protein